MMQASDALGRTFASNTCRLLGGMDDGINVGQCIREISEIQGVGNIVGLLVNVERWKERQSGKERASIRHPVSIQFDTERGAISAAREFRREYKRADGGGRRTLLLEHSNREMDISLKTLVCDGLRVGLGKDIDFFLQPWLVHKGTNEEYDIVNQPAHQWSVNRDGVIRNFGGGIGEEGWQYDN